MPKFPSIPRLTIVVPVTGDLAGFENSLVSVLENRPPGAEVLVPHDGTYGDPFDLADEVRFVVAASSSLTELIGRAASEARGRFIHILAEGVRATEDWIESALDGLEDPRVGCVAPVIRGAAGKVLAAGWTNEGPALCRLLGRGRRQVDRRSGVPGGPMLQASLWRRDVLRSLQGVYTGADTIEAAFAYGMATRHLGWHASLAPRCELQYDGERLRWDRPGFRRGQRLRAIHQAFQGGGESLTQVMTALALSPFRGGLLEALGQAFAGQSIGEITRDLHLPSAGREGLAPTLAFPEISGTERRAA